MDRASDFESAGWGFESLRVRLNTGVFALKTAIFGGFLAFPPLLHIFPGAIRCNLFTSMGFHLPHSPTFSGIKLASKPIDNILASQARQKRK